MADDGQQQGGDGQQQAAAKTFTEAEYNERLAAFETEKAAILAKKEEALTEAKTAKAKLREIEISGKAQKAGVTSEELERIRAEITSDAEKRFGHFKTEAETLAAENRKLKLDNVVKDMMGKAGVRAERIDPLFRLTAPLFDLTEDGKPILKDRMGTPVEAFLKNELINEYPEFYQGTGSSGGGAAKSNAGGAQGITYIPAGDDKAFLANLSGIAKGTVIPR